jgi:hypothetical protein
MTHMSEQKPTQRQKQNVFERASGCCEYCLSRADFSPSPFAAEHILPRHAGGTNKLDNLALSCQACNNHKFTATEALDPGSGLIVPLFHPRRDKWSEHFSWSEDFLTIIGQTPTGRATVNRLQTNRASVVNLRRVLRLDGKHPPDAASKE